MKIFIELCHNKGHCKIFNDSEEYISNLVEFGKNIDDYNDYNTGLTEIFNGWLEGQYDDQSIMEYAYDCNDEQLGLFNLIPLIIYLKEKEII